MDFAIPAGELRRSPWADKDYIGADRRQSHETWMTVVPTKFERRTVASVKDNGNTDHPSSPCLNLFLAAASISRQPDRLLGPRRKPASASKQQSPLETRWR